jgi:Transposase, Mutator family
MTATLDSVANRRKDKPEPTAEQKLAEELVARAREQGVSLTGPDGLLKQLTKVVLETALNQEMTEHLGHDKHGPAGNLTGNVRNGTRPKTVLTEASGQVPIEVPRDRAGTFEPQIVRKRQRRLTGVDQMVLSLYAKGLTTGEICAHFAEIYGASVSGETISRITDKVIEEMNNPWAMSAQRWRVSRSGFERVRARPWRFRHWIMAVPYSCPSPNSIRAAAEVAFLFLRPAGRGGIPSAVGRPTPRAGTHPQCMSTGHVSSRAVLCSPGEAGSHDARHRPLDPNSNQGTVQARGRG